LSERSLYLQNLNYIKLANPYNILIALCVLVVASYLFNIVSSRIKIPSVILLLTTGIGLNYFGKDLGYELSTTNVLLELLGIVGLILIVLEGALDLKLTRAKIPLIAKSFFSALLILIATTGIICFIFIEFIELTWKIGLVYAVPLGVISSAIAIPSVQKLSAEKREFITYESTFSDIIGIMLFNYVILDNLLSSDSIGHFFFGLFLIILISAASSFVLLFLLNHATSHVKFYLIFAVLVLVYSVSKLFHLPSLLLILIFGLMLNNAHLFIKGRLVRYLHYEKLSHVTLELKLITVETAFIIRTFFFILFGYTMNLVLLQDINVTIIGSLIIATIIGIRFIFLRFISKSNLLPELFIAPRGLITIVLFYSIPASFQSDKFNEGILFFVIIVSAVIMMFGLMLSKTKFEKSMDDPLNL